MPLLYAVDFAVESKTLDSVATYQRAMSHLATWLHLDPDLDPFEMDGSATVPARQDPSVSIPTRSAAWTTLRTQTGDQGIRAVIAQADGAVEFSTVVSLTRCDDEVSVRAVLARDLAGIWLSPVEEAKLYQPGWIRELASDGDLQLKVQGQAVDSTALEVLRQTEAQVLAEEVAGHNRLPILLIHPRSSAAFAAAHALPRQLVGLVRVVVVNFGVARALGESTPSIDVPMGGALLVWPSESASSFAFGASELARIGADGLRAELMRRLAPISALARGSDHGWATMRSRVAREERAQTLARIEQARAESDVQVELAELKALVEQQRSDMEAWDALARDMEDRVQAAEAAAADRQRAVEEARSWREAYEQLTRGAESHAADPWESVETLVPGQDPTATFLALEEATEGRIVFTENAGRSWQLVAYPEPDDMTAKLVALSRAASRLYDGEQRSMPHLQKWFKTEFGINVALTDQTISKNKALRDFSYEGRNHSQVPHVKVRDGVKPNEVGRIHFALDPTEQRVIVNHVALKLYKT